MKVKGAIYCEQAYAQGKMLDHSSWVGRLPRGCRPSDFDMVLDNAGLVIFGELSSQTDDWCAIKPAQRMLYWNAIKGSRHVAVLCRHQVPATQQIDTCEDVQSFTLMYDVDGKPQYIHAFGNKNWQHFVTSWYHPHFHLLDWVNTLSPVDDPDNDTNEWVDEREDAAYETDLPLHQNVAFAQSGLFAEDLLLLLDFEND